jgi:predicted signal transduction protein with EAL and GGDEF domain
MYHMNLAPLFYFIGILAVLGAICAIFGSIGVVWWLFQHVDIAIV